MTQQEILEKLQDMARDISFRERMLNASGERRLAEYSAIWRLVNFKAQDIVRSTVRNDVENALLKFHTDLFSSMEYFRDCRIMALAELYGAAIDGLFKIRNVISAYIL